MFLRCTVSFLLHGIEHLVDSMSLVLVRETDETIVSYFYFMCTYYNKIYHLLCIFSK